MVITKSEILFHFRNVIDNINHDYLKFLLSQDVIKIKYLDGSAIDFYISNQKLIRVVIYHVNGSTKCYFYIKDIGANIVILKYTKEFKEFMMNT